jgi:hypothetical protein
MISDSLAAPRERMNSGMDSHPKSNKELLEKYRESHKLAKKLYDRFVEQYGSCICRDVQKRIFGRSFNMWDAKDYEEFEKAGGHRDKCPSVTGNVAMWATEILLQTEDASA